MNSENATARGGGQSRGEVVELADGERIDSVGRPNLVLVTEAVPEAEPLHEESVTASVNYRALTASVTHLDALTGEELEEFDSWPSFGRFVADRAGLKVEVDLVQRWRVGGHELCVSFRLDLTRQVYFLRVHDGWPVGSGPDERVPAPKSLCLAEVFAVSVTRNLRELRGPEMARWKRRALVEAKIVALPQSPLPALPEGAPTAAVTAWDVIAGLLAIRRLTEPVGEPIGLSSPFLAGWSGVEDRVIQAGKRWLARHGYIEHVGDWPVGKGRPLKLWRIEGDE